MSQQINLYRPIFRRQERKFSAKAMLQAGVAITVGVVLLYGLMAYQLNDMRAALRRAEQQHKEANLRLQELALRLGKSVPASAAVDQITRIEQEIAALRRTEQALNRSLLLNKSGYSDYFLALARQHMNGLWLTNIAIGEAGENLKLEGRTVDAVNVPRYVQRLAAERVLAGKEFEVFLLSGDKSRSTLEFSLKTTPDKDDNNLKKARRS